MEKITQVLTSDSEDSILPPQADVVDELEARINDYHIDFLKIELIDNRVESASIVDDDESDLTASVMLSPQDEGDLFKEIHDENSSNDIPQDGILDNIPIEELGLPIGLYNKMKHSGYNFVSKLADMTEEQLLEIRGLGKQTASKILKRIKELGFEKSQSSNAQLTKTTVQFRNTEGLLCDDVLIEDMDLSVRSYNVLRQAGYIFASQLIGITMEKLLEIKNLGRSSAHEIVNKINSLSFTESGTQQSPIEENLSCKTFTSVISTLLSIHGGKLYQELLPIFTRAEKIGCEVSYKELFSSVLLRNAVRDKIFSFLSDFKFGADIDNVMELFPDHIIESRITEEILYEMESEDKISNGNKIECRRITILEYLQNHSADRDHDIFFKRLQGLSLEDIGAEYGVGRERVRQIIARNLRKLKKTTVLAEDKYIDVFNDYEFTREDFSIIFNEDDIVYNYLRLVCDNTPTQSLEQFIEDETIPIEFRENAKKVLEQSIAQRYVDIGGEKVYKSRQEITNYVARTYFRYKDALFDDFVERYNMLLEEIGLAEDSQFIINARSYENYFASNEKIIWKKGRRFRYYDIESRDFTEFFQELALEQYCDIEYSTLKFFKEHSELMKRYDIRDEYGLHNLLKSLCRKSGIENVSFGRTPMIEFGKPNRDKQVVDLLIRLAPIKTQDFCDAYEAEYGVQAKTVQANFLKNFNNYLHNGVYSISTPPSLEKFTAQNKSSDSVEAIEFSQIYYDETVLEKLENLLSSRFTNGFRLNSPIEIMRFRSLLAPELGSDIKLSDEDLRAHVCVCGTVFDGKVYVVSSYTEERIKKSVEEYFQSGAQAIFFAEFYAKNEHWLLESSVVSVEMLINILRKLFREYSFTQTYFGIIKESVPAVLESEILRVWGDDLLLNYSELAERLAYVPIERIKFALARNGDFIWNSNETFTYISKIKISDEQRASIRDFVMQKCNVHEYVSITQLPLTEISEKNYELSLAAIQGAVYRICLSENFDRKGKIIARKGDVIDVMSIMKAYCRSVDRCTLEGLCNLQEELFEETHPKVPLYAASEVLVRINKEEYVADKYVNFHIEAIDDIIDSLLAGDYITLKSFTAFGAFPYCGQAWNLFLLESYCRRFSRKFRFDTPAVNSSNDGAIIRKSCTLQYIEIMSDAVANSDVALESIAVGKFLYESGYTSRSINSKTAEILAKARNLRERI